MRVDYKKIVFLLMLVFTSSDAYSDTFMVEEVEFDSHGTTLSGSIVFPQKDKMHSAVVFVHGSGQQERSIYWAERFAEQGVAALVYDKRGVGRSGGHYESRQSVSEKNIRLLADDAAVALQLLKDHVKTSQVPIGLTGISQAGWIVPIAAESTGNADFIALWSSPVCKVSEEDIYSKYTADIDHKEVLSYQEALNARDTKYVWPDFLGKDSDPSDNLANLDIPGFWVFGEKDGSVPVDLSVQRLKRLKQAGHNYSYVLFSDLGHNNMEDTFITVAYWIKSISE